MPRSVNAGTTSEIAWDASETGEDLSELPVRSDDQADTRTASAPPGRPVLELRDISLSYDVRGGTLEAVAPMSLTVYEGEFVCIVGPSGCGKTTLLRLIAGFLPPTTGEITDSGEPVRGPDARRGLVFQQPHLYPWLSVRSNVEFGPRSREIPRAERRRIADHYLKLVKLAEFAGARTWELSGGMQQRVALARVLANEPHILLMDEPFGALDALTREHMQDELLAIWRDTRPTIVLVTHSVEEAVYLATRILVSSDRPARIIADLDVPFSRRRQNRDVSSREPRKPREPREVKALPEFVEFRERVLRYIWT